MRFAPAFWAGPAFFGARVTRMSPDKRRIRRERSRMAKKKRSAALFEVMVKQEQRRLPRPPGMFRTLYLWFKNRPKPERVSVPAMTVAREEFSAPAEVEPSPPLMREIKYVPPPPEPEPQYTYDEPARETVTVNSVGRQ